MVEHDNFKEQFCEDEIPLWVCPHCNKGTLSITQNGFKVHETAETMRLRKTDQHEPDWDSGTFFGKLICSNAKCNELVFFTGDAGQDYHSTEPNDDFPGGSMHIYAWYITPRHFSRPIKLFPLESYYPLAILPTINTAFGLMWYDAASCANKIRISIELILDEFNIPSTTIGKDKHGKTFRQPLTLNSRLDKFTSPNLKTSIENKSKFKEAGDFLHAIKWIGNVGSHSQDAKLDRDALVEAFEMLEKVLDILFNPRSIALKKRATKIIKKKGPAKRKK